MSTVANPPLIPWADVPEGHYVWFRLKLESPGGWECGKKLRERRFRWDGGVYNPDAYEFAAAEQGPGALAEVRGVLKDALNLVQAGLAVQQDQSEELTRLRAAIDPSGTIAPDGLHHLAAAHRQDSEDADVREATLERLRAGLAALEQAIREQLHDYSRHDDDVLTDYADRLAALREGR